MSKLVDNIKSPNHLSLIKDLIQQSNEVWISVAFLKQSGLNELKDSVQEALNKGTVFKVYCGLDLCITEPSGLRQLYSMLKEGDKNKLKILFPDGQFTFHPKIY